MHNVARNDGEEPRSVESWPNIGFSVLEATVCGAIQSLLEACEAGQVTKADVEPSSENSLGFTVQRYHYGTTSVAVWSAVDMIDKPLLQIQDPVSYLFLIQAEGGGIDVTYVPRLGATDEPKPSIYRLIRRFTESIQPFDVDISSVPELLMMHAVDCSPDSLPIK